MKLAARWVQHVSPRSTSVFHLLVMRFRELLEFVLHFLFAKDSSYGMFGLVVFFMKNVPTGRFRELGDDCKEYDWVYLHRDDGHSPGPLVLFSKVVGEDYVEDEGHVETKYVGLEFLREGHATSIVFLRFGGVDRNNSIGTTWRKNSSVIVPNFAAKLQSVLDLTNAEAHNHPTC